MIRGATTTDASNIAALSIQVWLHTYAKSGLRNALSDYVLAEYTPEKIAERLRDKDQVFLARLWPIRRRGRAHKPSIAEGHVAVLTFCAGAGT
jgi:hypothetical protein